MTSLASAPDHAIVIKNTFNEQIPVTDYKACNQILEKMIEQIVPLSISS